MSILTSSLLYFASFKFTPWVFNDRPRTRDTTSSLLCLPVVKTWIEIPICYPHQNTWCCMYYVRCTIYNFYSNKLLGKFCSNILDMTTFLTYSYPTNWQPSIDDLNISSKKVLPYLRLREYVVEQGEVYSTNAKTLTNALYSYGSHNV